MMAVDPRKILKARRNGIVNPVLAWRASDRAGIPYFVACAFLEQESSGGMNVYGSDTGQQFAGFGAVTEANYEIYRKQRDMLHACGRGYGSQGVGPMQLTYFSLQDLADEAGGCWVPLFNMVTAFDLLADYRLSEGSWHDAARRYNGSGDAAEDYADKVDLLIQKWREILA